MDYAPVGGVWRHPDRQAVFLGDFIDRGPQIREVLQIVRPMVEEGAALAVMGNHEFNAITFHTEHLDTVTRSWLRARTLRHIRAYLETIRQIRSDTELEDHIEWFKTLPLWLELDGLRVVHACWDPSALALIEQRARQTGGTNDAFFRMAAERDDALFGAVETVLKGPEMDLPAGCSFKDSDGNTRKRSRTRWYLTEPERRTWREYSFAFDRDVVTAIPDEPLGDSEEGRAVAATATPYPEDAPPVFIGHYWMPGEVKPAPLAENVVCLDYSVARKGGVLCGYRWDEFADWSAHPFVTSPQ